MSIALSYSKTDKKAEWTEFKMQNSLIQKGYCVHKIKLWHQPLPLPFSDWTRTKRTCKTCEKIDAKETLEIFIYEAELEEKKEEAVNRKAKNAVALVAQPRQVEDMPFTTLSGVQSKYTGTVNASGKRHGKGVACWDNGDRYDGLWEGDVPARGRGVYTWADGTRYEGELKGGLRHGRGVCTWADGTRYEGEWKGGLSHGRVVCTNASGIRYEGETNDGKRHGRGVLTLKDGSILYDGLWENDKRYISPGMKLADLAVCMIAPQLMGRLWWVKLDVLDLSSAVCTHVYNVHKCMIFQRENHVNL